MWEIWVLEITDLRKSLEWHKPGLPSDTQTINYSRSIHPSAWLQRLSPCLCSFYVSCRLWLLSMLAFPLGSWHFLVFFCLILSFHLIHAFAFSCRFSSLSMLLFSNNLFLHLGLRFSLELPSQNSEFRRLWMVPLFPLCGILSSCIK